MAKTPEQNRAAQQRWRERNPEVNRERVRAAEAKKPHLKKARQAAWGEKRSRERMLRAVKGLITIVNRQATLLRQIERMLRP